MTDESTKNLFEKFAGSVESHRNIFVEQQKLLFKQVSNALNATKIAAQNGNLKNPAGKPIPNIKQLEVILRMTEGIIDPDLIATRKKIAKIIRRSEGVRYNVVNQKRESLGKIRKNLENILEIFGNKAN